MQIRSLGQKDLLEEGMATHPVFLWGEPHGQRSLAGYSPWGCTGWPWLKQLGTHTLMLLLLSLVSCVPLCGTPQTAAHQAPLSLGFSRQGYWSGLPFETESSCILFKVFNEHCSWQSSTYSILITFKRFGYRLRTYPADVSLQRKAFFLLWENQKRDDFSSSFIFCHIWVWQNYVHTMLLFFPFWPWYMACGIFISWPGTEPRPLAVKAQSPSHRTAAEFPHYVTNRKSKS